MKKSNGIISAIGRCAECDVEWQSKNAVALAAIHAKRKGHKTTAEQVVGFSFDGSVTDD